MTFQELTFVLDTFDKLIIRYEKTTINTVLDRAIFDHELDSLMERKVSYIGTIRGEKGPYIVIELE